MRLVLALLGIAIVGTVLFHRRAVESQLLRAEPQIIPADPALMHFAVAQGESLFQNYCAGCHGNAGEGNPGHGIPNLADQDWLYGSGKVMEIERVIEYGIRSNHPKAWDLARMPAYARAVPGAAEPNMPALAPGQLDDVIEYLLYLQGRSADHAAALRGAKAYGGTGGCYDCHGTDARGDPAIGAPNLSDRITLYGDGGRRSLFDSIAYGRQGVCPAWTDRIGPAGIREIALYVYSLSHRLEHTHVR